jgi:hypothetical protein
MNRTLYYTILYFAGLLTFFVPLNLTAQVVVCDKVTIFKIDFGAGNSPDMNLSLLRNYDRAWSDCPADGYYAFPASTSECFGGNWITVPEDHTPGDAMGKMMLVNAAGTPGDFFILKASGLKGNTTYEWSAWLVNVCRAVQGCRQLYPEIDFIVTTTDNKWTARYSTGALPADKAPFWIRYSFRFTTPAVIGDLVFKLADQSEGGCGNDFALDDLLVTRCDTIKPPPVIPPPVVKQPVKKPAPVKQLTPVKKKDTIAKREVVITESPPVIKPVIKEPVILAVPVSKVLQVRSNPIVKQIYTDSAELQIELFDNGVIDGDTVSVYHNNELVIANRALSTKPIRLTIKVDAKHPHHEIVMVANNLGSIPPNTSLMIVKAKEKRYEVFISSDDKKNARVVIDLEQ